MRIVIHHRDANPDGTISPDEEGRMRTLIEKARRANADLRAEAYEIGGSFRGPGYWAQVKRVLGGG